MKRPFLPLLLLACLLSAAATAATIKVDAGRPGAAINPAMWGLFFEDINFGADGGLYGELVKNRGFEFPEALTGWIRIRPSNARGELTVESEGAFDPANPRYVRLHSTAAAPFGISNAGFRGMGVREGATYDFSARARAATASPKVRLTLYAENGFVLDSVELGGIGSAWGEVKATLRPKRTDARARIAVHLEAPGTLDLDFVSLFPRETWRSRPGGLRADMVQALADLRPGFFRFPGGCIVEGSVLAHRYRWKDTVGPVHQRPVLVNRWNYEFVHRPAPDYFQSFGVGFFEYFQLCEDIGAEPMPIVNCGMACQFNSGELVPLDQLEPYIQDALDLIEFANGPLESKWGAVRAAMGHPAPFGMKMLGIGNEQWGPQYVERYARFAEVLKARHPEIALIAAAGPQPEDERFHFLWSKLRPLGADIIDEHSYAPPEWFLDNANRYDRYDRNGPKVFVGEYAAQSVRVVSPDNRNTWLCALAEAAFMTGLERNADVVRMASYAPLFGHVDAWQWTPNLIWVDNLKVVPTANYHVQQLYARNRGDRVVPVALDGLSGEQVRRLYASAVLDEAAGELVLKVVNATAAEVRPKVELAGVAAAGNGRLTLLAAEPESFNTMDNPSAVAPTERRFDAAGSSFELPLPAHSFAVLRLPLAR